MDLAVRIYYSAQRAVMGSTDEIITEAVLDVGSNIAIRATRSHVEMMSRTLHISNLKRNRNVDSCDYSSEPAGNESSELIVNNNSKAVIIPGDLARPQHPEFMEALTELQFSDNLSEIIDII